MDSSTLRSKGRLPRRACALLLGAILSWVVSAALTCHYNFFSRVEPIKTSWADKMTREFGPKVVVYGGSSCAFSIDGERLLRRDHLPTVNDGLDAGMGAFVLTDAALRHVHRGDTLIVALEPGLLTARSEPRGLAAQFCVASGHPEMALHPVLGVGALSDFQLADGLRPGGYWVFTMLGKLAMGRPWFRYTVSDFRPSGWAQTSVRVPFDGPPAHGEALSPDGAALLGRLRDWCHTNDVRVAYSLPWMYTPSSAVREFQRQNARFLEQISAFFPVLKDARLGADSDRSDFADTNFHLATAAAELRTDELGEQILHWRVWKTAELQDLGKTPDLAKDSLR